MEPERGRGIPETTEPNLAMAGKLQDTTEQDLTAAEEILEPERRYWSPT